jgi:hypothetical protein
MFRVNYLWEKFICVLVLMIILAMEGCSKGEKTTLTPTIALTRLTASPNQVMGDPILMRHSPLRLHYQSDTPFRRYDSSCRAIQLPADLNRRIIAIT